MFLNAGMMKRFECISLTKRANGLHKTYPQTVKFDSFAKLTKEKNKAGRLSLLAAEKDRSEFKTYGAILVGGN